MKFLSPKIRTRKGFTLVELLVAISVFVIFLGVMMNSYISIVRGHRDANEIRRMYSDARFFMDFVTDEMRKGTIDYQCYWKGAQLPTIQATQSNQLARLAQPQPTLNFALLGANQPTNLPVIEAPKPTFNNLYCSKANLMNGGSDHLAIISKDGLSRTLIQLDEGKVKVMKETRNSLEEPGKAAEGYEAGFQEFGMEHVKIDSLWFDIDPIDDPYSSDNVQYNGIQYQPKVTVRLKAGVKDNADETADAKYPIEVQTTISSRVYSKIL